MKEGLSSSEYRIQTGWLASDTLIWVVSSLCSENTCWGSSGLVSAPSDNMQSDIFPCFTWHSKFG